MGVRRWKAGRWLAAPVVGLTAVSLGLAAGPGFAPAGASSSPFIVVIDTGITGPYGANGTSALQGTEAAANVLNKTQGGILGHKVKVVPLDNDGNPTTAATLLEQYLSTNKPNMIVPGSISTEGVVEVPIANAADILSIGTPNASSLDNPKKYPDEFFAAPNANLPAVSLMDYAKSHHYTKLAMIYSSDAYGASVGQATIAAAKAAGLTMDTATYNDTDLSVTSELQQLEADHPQMLYAQGFAAPDGIIMQDLYTLGWKVPTIGDLTFAATPLIATDANQPDEKGLLLQDLRLAVYSANEPTAVKNYVHAMETFGPITTPLITTSYQYDSVMVVAQAAKQAKSIATPAMVKALDHLKQPAHPLWVTLDKYVYTPTNHAPQASPSNWIVVPVSTLVNGQYDAPGS